MSDAWIGRIETALSDLRVDFIIYRKSSEQRIIELELQVKELTQALGESLNGKIAPELPSQFAVDNDLNPITILLGDLGPRNEDHILRQGGKLDVESCIGVHA